MSKSEVNIFELKYLMFLVPVHMECSTKKIYLTYHVYLSQPDPVIETKTEQEPEPTTTEPEPTTTEPEPTTTELEPTTTEPEPTTVSIDLQHVEYHIR